MILFMLLLLFGVLLALQYGRMIFTYGYAEQITTIRPCWPIIGHSLVFWGKSTKQAFWLVVQYFSKVDRLGKLMVGPLPILLVNHPDLLQQILTRNDMQDKPFFYDFMDLGGGLISERSGERWRRSRKVLNPTFNTRMLTGFIPIMDARACKLATQLRTVADGCTEIDIFKYISNCTLDMVFSTTIKRNTADIPGQQEYIRNLEVLMNTIGERILNVNQFVEVLYRKTKLYKAYQASKMINDLFVRKIVHERRQELKDEDSAEIDKNEFKKKSLNFLDQILTIRKEDGTEFYDHEIYDHLSSIIGAGNDTTALTVGYTCLFLAMYPEIQAKVKAEMDEVFHSASVEITQDSLKQLQYTEMVLKEVLRMCPSVPFAARQTGGEIHLDGVRIPKGQIIAMNFYALHHRKDLWGLEPERFDPERFRPEAIQERHPYAFLPFSGGLRNCIGARYAMNSMRVMLLRVLQEFDIKTNLKQTDLRFKFEITMKLVGPHSVWLTKRNKC